MTVFVGKTKHELFRLSILFSSLQPLIYSLTILDIISALGNQYTNIDLLGFFSNRNILF